MTGEVHHKEALSFLKELGDSSIDMIYTDPPFGTGNVQTMSKKVSGKIVSKMSYVDRYEDYLEFILPHLNEMHRVLKDTGTMYLHLDWRWVHYVKVECDKIFGYDNFLNEVIWSYNAGGRGSDRWPKKHDTILVYTKSIDKHVFNWDNIDRIPYTTPALQYVGRTKEEAEKRIAAGQVPTDVWNITLGNMDSQRTGYPSQKPIKLVKRTIVASSNPEDLVLDPFGGSGTTGVAALESGRRFLLCDKSPDAINVMKSRFAGNSSVKFL